MYNAKYLLKYFIYEKMVRTMVDQDRGGHFTVPSINQSINFDLEVNFQGQIEVRPFY